MLGGAGRVNSRLFNPLSAFADAEAFDSRRGRNPAGEWGMWFVHVNPNRRNAMHPLFSCSRAALLLGLAVLFAMPLAASAQAVLPPAQIQFPKEVLIRVQSVDVSAEELAKVEQAAAVPPATGAALAAQLQTVLVGPGAYRLRDELAKSRLDLLRATPFEMTTPDGVPASLSVPFSMTNMTIIPNAAYST